MKTFMAFITRILNREYKPAKENALPVRNPEYRMVPDENGFYRLYKNTGFSSKLISVVADEQEAKRCIYNLERPEILVNVNK